MMEENKYKEFDERYVKRTEHMQDLFELKENFTSLRKDVAVIKWTMVSIAGTTIATLVSMIIGKVI